MPRHSSGHRRWSTSASSAHSRRADPRHCRPPACSPRLHSGRPTPVFSALMANREIHSAMRNRRPVQPRPSRVSDREFCPGGRDAGHAETDTPIPLQRDMRLPEPPLTRSLAPRLQVARLRQWKVWKRRVTKCFPFRAEVVNPERNGLEAQSQLCFKQ